MNKLLIIFLIGFIISLSAQGESVTAGRPDVNVIGSNAVFKSVTIDAVNLDNPKAAVNVEAVTALNKSMWEIDIYGGLVPAESIGVSVGWEYDEYGGLVPKL